MDDNKLTQQETSSETPTTAETSTPTANNQQPKAGKKKLAIVIVLIVIILGAISVYAYSHYDSNEKTTEIAVAPTKQAPVNTNWETYTLKTTPMSFSYPSGLLLTETNPGVEENYDLRIPPASKENDKELHPLGKVQAQISITNLIQKRMSIQEASRIYNEVKQVYKYKTKEEAKQINGLNATIVTGYQEEKPDGTYRRYSTFAILSNNQGQATFQMELDRETNLSEKDVDQTLMSVKFLDVFPTWDPENPFNNAGLTPSISQTLSPTSNPTE